MSQKETITIQNSLALDCLSLMYRVTNVDVVIDEDMDKRVARNDEVEQWVKHVAEQLDDEWKKEFEVFFNSESYIAISTITHIIRHQVHETVPQYINMLKNIDVQTLSNGFLNVGMNPDYKEVDFESTDQTLQTIQKLNLVEEEKWKLLYLIHDGEHTKQRLIKLIEYFYEHFYKNREDEFYRKQERYLQQLHSDDSKLIKLLNNYGGLQGGKDVLLFPSYCLNTGVIIAQIASEEPLICVLGLERLNAFVKETDDKETLELLRVLTDERRFKLLQLLSKRPCYGYELAQELKISNSTISHHLSTLLTHQFVESKRVENKVYYQTNKEEIKQVLDQFQSLFN
ncbi:ArsR family transcriptional regulator [Filobacillus milosensis]|uniref:ArsR family transcriptional regulator n=1 Tax=Filobacillus milosensis TaxID=94137 RepID=A0A4Y8IFA8_9BACI|nr:winged helix-turn-helix domain-containing protein [Filobacillus milosensis]TFB18885.1 ArsR family transcriptional regulator [Filobacillus milosensis]